MLYDLIVSEHYKHGDLLNAIESALPAIGKSTETVTVEDLAPVDEFHIGGRLATHNLVNQLNFPVQGRILDVGCGLGGAARYVYTKYENPVTGIDLTPEYIETGKALCHWLNLDGHITLKEGSALSMPFDDNTFDGSYMLHVGMNIKDKHALFNEINRVLKPGSSFGIYDILRQEEGELVYPVPWASESRTSKLATANEYKQALSNAGFEVLRVNNRCSFALDFFKQQRAKTIANVDPPPLGLHTLMQASTANKINNMIENIGNGYIAPVELIAQKC